MPPRLSLFIRTGWICSMTLGIIHVQSCIPHESHRTAELRLLEILLYSSIPGPGPPCRPICLAFRSSSHRRRLDAIPELEATQFLRTRKESYTPSSTGSIGSP